MPSRKDVSQTIDFWRKLAEDFYSVSTKDWAEMTDAEHVLITRRIKAWRSDT